MKQIWCFLMHIPMWRKYEIVGGTEPDAVGRICAQCSKCGGLWKLWKAEHDIGKKLYQRKTHGSERSS
jgi:hypothetical protein